MDNNKGMEINRTKTQNKEENTNNHSAMLKDQLKETY